MADAIPIPVSFRVDYRTEEEPNVSSELTLFKIIELPDIPAPGDHIEVLPGAFLNAVARKWGFDGDVSIELAPVGLEATVVRGWFRDRVLVPEVLHDLAQAGWTWE